MDDPYRAVPSSRVQFAKVEALGNDLIWVIDPPAIGMGLLPQVWIVRACDRHRGIGADGIVWWDGNRDRPRVWFANADGSPAEVCGNGLRALAVAGRDLGLFSAGDILFHSGDMVFPVCVETAGPVASAGLGPPQIETSPPVDAFLRQHHFTGVLVRIPNPHVVILEGPWQRPERETLAAQVNALIPGGANVGFTTVEGASLRLHVHERGVGWTEACGSGAAAAYVAAVATARLPDEGAMVTQPGGDLWVRRGSDDRVWIRGTASLVFVGTASGSLGVDDQACVRGDAACTPCRYPFQIPAAAGRPSVRHLDPEQQ